MINGHPTEDELRNRILHHFEWRNSSDAVALIWRGYLAGLSEWGLIEQDFYQRLCSILPEVGYKEIHELFLDEPISSERAEELDDYVENLIKEILIRKIKNFEYL
ncbi:hypothetical protein [Pseudacidovorax sp. NFM-22]|uniref:hypothetical protein n=1 Tax=Pseudacidovorax sp. NFM-22 TaxID=2744469 RepID=UPI001F34B3A7|nr:hypothetical protein [Pseudacidovorax sp. NFM-22]